MSDPTNLANTVHAIHAFASEFREFLKWHEGVSVRWDEERQRLQAGWDEERQRLLTESISRQETITNLREKIASLNGDIKILNSQLAISGGPDKLIMIGMSSFAILSSLAVFGVLSGFFWYLVLLWFFLTVLTTGIGVWLKFCYYKFKG